jgi:uncharacterized protein VirK/YbjX
MNMLIRYLARHWYASRRSYPPSAWIASVARSLRVLRWPRRHRELCSLDVYRRYVATDGNHDVFHHLSHRHFLSRHLAPSQRVACMLDHYHFESTAFDENYKRKVYRGRGLRLWQHAAGGQVFSIWLMAGQRYLGEGDLDLVLYLGDELLHRVGFSWVKGSIAGLRPAVTPLIARNQGRWRDDKTDALYAAFAAAFPQNSPAYFCASAMQGLALAVASPQLLCVRSELAPSFQPGPGSNHAAAYDRFWDAFGGARAGAGVHVIPVPFQLRDLAQLASKHRRRATIRRACWQRIGESARAALRQHIVAMERTTQDVT